MLNLGVGSLWEKPPTWKSENGAGCWVVQSASAAEIFIGCSRVTRMPKWLPNHMLKLDTGTSTISATFAAGRKIEALRPRARCQQATPKTTAEPAVSPARMVCTNAYSDHSLESSAHTLVRCASPFTSL